MHITVVSDYLAWILRGSVRATIAVAHDSEELERGASSSDLVALGDWTPPTEKRDEAQWFGRFADALRANQTPLLYYGGWNSYTPAVFRSPVREILPILSSSVELPDQAIFRLQASARGPFAGLDFDNAPLAAYHPLVPVGEVLLSTSQGKPAVVRSSTESHPCLCLLFPLVHGGAKYLNRWSQFPEFLGRCASIATGKAPPSYEEPRGLWRMIVALNRSELSADEIRKFATRGGARHHRELIRKERCIVASELAESVGSWNLAAQLRHRAADLEGEEYARNVKRAEARRYEAFAAASVGQWDQAADQLRLSAIAWSRNLKARREHRSKGFTLFYAGMSAACRVQDALYHSDLRKAQRMNKVAGRLLQSAAELREAHGASGYMANLSTLLDSLLELIVFNQARGFRRFKSFCRLLLAGRGTSRRFRETKQAILTPRVPVYMSTFNALTSLPRLLAGLSLNQDSVDELQRELDRGVGADVVDPVVYWPARRVLDELRLGLVPPVERAIVVLESRPLNLALVMAAVVGLYFGIVGFIVGYTGLVLALSVWMYQLLRWRQRRRKPSQ